MDSENLTQKKKPRLIPSVRFMLAFLGFLLTAIQYMQRINMSVAIVCMVNNTALRNAQSLEIKNVSNDAKSDLANQNDHNSDSNSECPVSVQTSNATISDGPFEWDKGTQGFVLSSFFYGYMLTQIIGAMLSIRFGPKIVLFISILVASLFTIATPLAANFHYIALAVCRIIIGIAHGVVWPAMGSLWPYWAPPLERSTILGFSSAGSQIGNVITLPLGGFLCEYAGWPSIFYVIGSVGLVWCILWFALVTDSPQHHKFIGHDEKTYIINETKDAVHSSSDNKKRKIPYTKIITSRVFYALLITHTCSNFGTYLFLTQLPTYMKEVLKFDIKSNGGLSALPYLAFWLFTLLSGIVSDKIIQSKKLSRNLVRKIFNSIGFLVPMAGCILLMFVSCQNPYMGVLLVTISLAFSGFSYGSGFLVNYNDVGGVFSGMVFAISNTIGTIAGIVAPTLVGILTKNQTQEEWRTVFMITAGVYFTGALAFVILSKADTQKWALKQQTKLEQGGEEIEEMKAPLTTKA